MGRLLRAILLGGLAACSVFDREPLPPRGEALIVVDTDLPVPRVASRLRVDVSTEDGRWLATRDDVRPDPRDWPASFSVFTDDEARPRVLLVRLRAYPDARVIAYRAAARVEGGLTPDVEPEPSLAVDRTIRVELVHGRRGRVRVTLRGECAGVAGCGDLPAELEPTMDRDVPSVSGTFGRAPCDAVPVVPGRACVPGGAFIFGDAFYRPSDSGTARPVDARPERVVALSRFMMDEREVSVGRFRAALARGFRAPTPVQANEKDGEPAGDPTAACTWSAAPRGREAYPLSCVTWDTARALCRFEGGDLPTEAQWEYAALAAGRPAKATYPWGEAPPSCERAVYGRSRVSADCIDRGEGLAPSDAPSGDVSAVGVRDLAASLEEHVRDDHAALSADCWARAPRFDPTCELPPPPECVPDVDALACRAGAGIVKSARGGSWFSSRHELRVVDRARAGRLGRTSDSLTGFRCVYPA